MVKVTSSGLFCLLLTATALPAQSRAGLLVGMPPPGVITTTWSVAVGAELMLRVPGEAIRGLGTYVPPASHRIVGAVLRLGDATPGDGEVFDLHVYLGQPGTQMPTIPGPAAPGTTAVASVTDLTTPAGVTDHTLEILFPHPVLVPIGRDLFVSVHVRTSGLRIRAVGGTAVPGFVTSLLDACGAGLGATEAFSVIHDLGSLTPGGSATVGFQPMFDLLVEGSSGVAVVQRAPGTAPTASFYSGLHPDSASPSNQPGRHDLPGYVFLANDTVPVGTPVFVLGSTLPFAWQPWIVLSPGDAILHLVPVGLVGLAMGTVGGDGTATMYWPVPASPAVRGLEVRTQGFAFDSVDAAVRGGAAVLQRF